VDRAAAWWMKVATRAATWCVEAATRAEAKAVGTKLAQQEQRQPMEAELRVLEELEWEVGTRQQHRGRKSKVSQAQRKADGRILMGS
jgi:CO/xanthine dehydrogenase Mo-binding subunit